MSVKDMLKEEIKNRMESLKDLEIGSDEYRCGVVDVATMYDKLNDIEKTELDHLDKVESRKQENDLKQKEMKEERFDRIVKNVLTGVTFAASLGVTIWANVDSKRFEQGFTHTTEAGRGSTRKLLNLLDKFK